MAKIIAVTKILQSLLNSNGIGEFDISGPDTARFKQAWGRAYGSRRKDSGYFVTTTSLEERAAFISKFDIIIEKFVFVACECRTTYMTKILRCNRTF